ncbi:MAG: nuclear transport factor 2 family protein [Terriglobales bacterium]
MKGLGSWTIRIVVLGILCFGALPAWSQGENPPASTKESGATSGHGMTLVEQGYKQAVEDQIRTLHEERWQAALKNDVDFFEKALAQQYFGIGADGRSRTKAETIESFKSGAVKYETIDERDVTVDAYGNAAIVSSTAVVTASIQGKSLTGDYRATSVYVKEGSNWREVAFELVPVTKKS